MIVATHEIGFACEIADTMAFLDHGAIIEHGHPRQLLTRPQHERTRGCSGVSGPVPRSRSKNEDVAIIPRHPPRPASPADQFGQDLGGTYPRPIVNTP